MTLRLQDSPSFELLRNYLRAAGFNAKSICGRLDINGLPDLLSTRGKGATSPQGLDELNLLTRLLLLGEFLKKEELESVLSLRIVGALTD